MQGPADPKTQGNRGSEPIDIKHQLGLVRKAVIVPQPGIPKFVSKLPPQTHNIAALGGIKQK